MENKAVISICVITYNSSKYIIATLESIRKQTYQNIELIVSDDCSVDNTVEICRGWFESNNERFARTQLLTIDHNTGVCANCNRAMAVATGEWIKLIAGDDCLMPEAIEEYVWFSLHENCKVCVSGMTYIDENSNTLNDELKGAYSTYMEHLKESQGQQYKRILRGLFIPSPPIFLHKEVFVVTKGTDERFPFADEWTWFYRILKNGYRIYPLNKKLVLYRVRLGSLCRDRGGISVRVLQSQYDFYMKVIRLELIKEKQILSAWDGFLYYYSSVKRSKNDQYKYLLLLSPKWYLRKIGLLKK